MIPTAAGPAFAWMVVAQASPLRVRGRGESGLGVEATAAPGVTLAVKQRVLVATVGTETVVMAAGPTSTSTPAAAGVYVPGDDGSVWQVKATSAGTLYTTKVS